MKGSWTSKTVILALVILTGFLARQKYTQYILQKAIQAEKDNLKSQLGELEGKSQELTETLSYLNSDSYKELIARQQLNMQKQGELVYNFSDQQAKPESGTENLSPPSNFKKWTGYFLNQ